MNFDQVVVTPGDATVTPDTEIDVDEEVAKAFIFDPGVELSEIVESINAVGASASDLVAILEALREAGSLRAIELLFEVNLAQILIILIYKI